MASAFELLSDVTYLSRKMHISPNDIWELPHSHFLAYVRHNWIFDLQETEEGREYLEKAERYQNPRTKADISAIRSFGGYSGEKAGEK
ncbi:hypothetical protein [Paraliobacillus sp. X-1268]|uniref:hypothetical protein n=1 Tax=Paraliobacillus sp. X-1268 TaxID=2213193 RepID=UPI000E3C3FAB|nr:hypothetical protein [Paraliobacillus sp. X-1268]